LGTFELINLLKDFNYADGQFIPKRRV